MDTKKLMIGDFVEYRGQAIKVTSLYAKNDSNEVGFSNKEDVWVHGSVLNPIPITSEILQKNGFTDACTSPALEGMRYWYQGTENYISDTDLLVTELTEELTESKVFCVRWRSHSFPSVKYVHELQHIFYFCHINKEIKL